MSDTRSGRVRPQFPSVLLASAQTVGGLAGGGMSSGCARRQVSSSRPATHALEWRRSSSKARSHEHEKPDPSCQSRDTSTYSGPIRSREARPRISRFAVLASTRTDTRSSASRVCLSIERPNHYG